MLTTTPAELAERRRAIDATPVLGRLRDRLRAQVQPLLDRSIYIPERKALLSRDGGVCPADGSRLRFDPFSPDRHQCPRCGTWYEGERHHRAWITRYQVWLSERAIHLALLGALGNDPVLTARSQEILAGYATRYRSYPNRDNVLGPTRLFFSTYLESIWLCQVCIAASLLDVHGFSWNGDVREQLRSVVAESAEIIGSFDEGWSNRQTWNNAALIGVGRWLGDDGLVAAGLQGPHGISKMLGAAVSADGLWFEGENYHFFALRGLLLGVEFLRRDGFDFYAERAGRNVLAALFTSPLKTLLPDLTLPARGDSPYGVSVRQPRFAELWEIGRVRTEAPLLEPLLAELYRDDGSPGEDFGLLEMAEQEQNRPPQRLSRDLLGWKALAWMAPADPVDSVDSARWQPGSVLLADHGVAVLRHRDRYVSIECGGDRGGHGHPDLLHLTLHWSAPWLMDPGTGSYVSPSLHWYRSTLAHNAPTPSGGDQRSREGWCVAFDQDGDWAWIRAEARDLLGGGSAAWRTLVAGPDWVLDLCEIEAPDATSVDFPLHPAGTLSLPPRLQKNGASAQSPVRIAAQLAAPVSWFTAIQDGLQLYVAAVPRDGEKGYVAVAPGPPDINLAEGPPTEFLLRRAPGTGRWIQAYSQRPVSVEADASEIRVTQGQEILRIQILRDRVRIRLPSGEVVKLSGSREPPFVPRAELPEAITVTAPLVEAHGRQLVAPSHKPVHRLGADQYRRSEEPYDPADFSARISIVALGSELTFGIDVTEPDLVVRRPDAPDPRLDNEAPDIHSDGVQLYVGDQDWQGFVLVPDLDSEKVYVRPVAGTPSDPRRITATWERTTTGYRMVVSFDVGRAVQRGDHFLVNAVINRMHAGRERRAGQLALSGDGGWVYLRGDRESPANALVVEIA